MQPAGGQSAERPVRRPDVETLTAGAIDPDRSRPSGEPANTDIPLPLVQGTAPRWASDSANLAPRTDARGVAPGEARGYEEAGHEEAGHEEAGHEEAGHEEAGPKEAGSIDGLEGLAVAADPAGAYLHVPFCFHKCHYCDFYSFVDAQDRQGAFAARLAREIEVHASLWRRPARTLFVGGGTPTLLEAGPWRTILEAVDRFLPRAADAEWTVEANPETVTDELLETLAAGGVNRISIGCQSFDPRHLRTLERHHDPASVERAVACVRRAGIARVSLDLIFGIPGQTLGDWERDLDRAIELDPGHLSCYGLMYEPNTALTERVRQGLVEPIDPDLEAAMYERLLDRLADAGFEQYEISNWARPGEACRHNLLYWRDEEWLAFGPSASGHAGGWRWKNVPRLSSWLEHGPWSPIVDVEGRDDEMRAAEGFMLGLRLTEGIADTEVERLLALGDGGTRRRDALAAAEDDGRLERAGGRLRFTRRGRLLADTLLRELV